MSLDSILIKFLVITVVIFFLPKVVDKFYKVPHPLTEVILGIILGIAIPHYFFVGEMLQILSTIGIIVLFVYAGLEVDTRFMSNNKRFFIENMVLHLLIFLGVGFFVQWFFRVDLVVAFLISLALTTPSASYILSVTKGFSKKALGAIAGKAIIGEVTAIFLMIILLRLQDIWNLLLVLGIVVAIIVLLPIVLEFLYKHLFSDLIGTEFSFIFVVAIISAFITDIIGVHFLDGAFIAGVVARRFIADMVRQKKFKTLSNATGKKIIGSFGFFTITFAPFYFFTVGLKIDQSLLQWQFLVIAFLFVLAVLGIRIFVMGLHRKLRHNEKFKEAFRIANMTMPTLIFTFVIAELLVDTFNVSALVFGVLMVYGVMTALVSLLFSRFNGLKKAI